MAYVVLVVSAWLCLSAATALRPSRRGLFAALAFPVGWAAGELAGQALAVEVALAGLLVWLGWPQGALGVVVDVLVALCLLENAALVAISFRARTVVRHALEGASRRPLAVGRPGEDRFGRWWRTAIQFPYHPRDLELLKDLPYGPEERHRLDVWRGPGAGPGAPVILYVHGGAWTMGDKREQGRPMLHEFVARGWIAVSCNYRLAPRHPWPAQIEDVVLSLSWIKREIAALGGDPDRVVISGGSAGGHLAALVALAAADPAWRPEGTEDLDLSVRGAIPFYGVLEMTGDERHWRGLGAGLRTLLVGRVLQRPFEGHEELYRSVSPLHRLHADAPPFLVVQGVTDTLVDVQVARDFVARHEQVALTPIYYVELPFTQHAFDVTASPRTSATTRAAVAFAESVTAARPALSEELAAAYQSPPVRLLVEVEPGRWEEAPSLTERLGPFAVVTPDHPFSVPHDERATVLRREEFTSTLAARGLATLKTRAEDPTGRWPDEHGAALVGEDRHLARALAAAFDQFAYYLIADGRVEVLDSRSGARI